MSSRLIFKYGVMGSAKSAELLLSAHQVRERGMNTILIKPSVDNRDTKGMICSRVGLKEKCILIDKNDSIIEKIGNLDNIDFVYADESQFFSKKQIDELSDIVDKFNVNVICYGLRGDFMSSLFEGSKRLLELSDKIEEVKSTCECGKKAIINARIDKNGNVVTEGNQVEIGGDDKYIALCRKCWKNKMNTKFL